MRQDLPRSRQYTSVDGPQGAPPRMWARGGPPDPHPIPYPRATERALRYPLDNHVGA
jgi:hypothetical protein